MSWLRGAPTRKWLAHPPMRMAPGMTARTSPRVRSLRLVSSGGESSGGPRGPPDESLEEASARPARGVEEIDERLAERHHRPVPAQPGIGRVHLEDGAAASLPGRPRIGEARRGAVADDPVVVRNPVARTPRHDGPEPAQEEALRKLTLYLGGWGTDLAPQRQVTGHVAMPSPEHEQAQGIDQAEATARPTGHGADRHRPLQGAVHR